MRDFNLKATEHFEAVARLGTVTKAAAELGVSPSAVSQQIRLLEAQFGVKLFRREKRRLILTLDGDLLFQTTTHAFGALRNARSAVGRQRNLQGLTVRVSPSFGVRWLGARIARFAGQNPDWAIRIDATPELTAFETEQVDCDLRYGRGEWAGLSVTCFLQDMVLPMCSPGYRDRLRAEGQDLTAQLGAARLIDSAKTLYRWELWLASARIDLGDLSYPFRFDRSSMSIEMAKQSGGIALDSAALCKGELERGELVPLAPQIPVITFPAYWFVCPSRHLNRRVVARFSRWIAEEAEAHEAQVRGLLADLGCRFAPVVDPVLDPIQAG